VSLEGLQACSQLEIVDMAYCRSVSSLAPLSACAHLKIVYMSHTRVTSVEPLMACTQLEDLRMYGSAHPPGLAALTAALPQLPSRDIDRLYGCERSPRGPILRAAPVSVNH
jgi:hypothetical protein